MIEKIQQIKKSRLDDEEFKLFNLIDKLKIKKYKNIYLLVFNYDIYCEIDERNSIIWFDYDLFKKNDSHLFNFVKIRDKIGKYFDLNLENCNVFIFPTSYNRNVFYLWKKRKINFLYHFICLFKKNILSLSKV